MSMCVGTYIVDRSLKIIIFNDDDDDDDEFYF